MERVLFVNSRNKTLVGHLYPSHSRSIIIMAHGFTSDKCSKGRFEILANCFSFPLKNAMMQTNLLICGREI
ncbi:hypothetical protein [Bacillus alveayuensis]|jgi:hypothetical protein|uniref:hypothetical protein n=1 Tax=Aeribacillus alveayuensis TaxID=279215 RepID=UPI0005CD9682|nr:hypothetical protein [Bacillus alveayuensis]